MIHPGRDLDRCGQLLGKTEPRPGLGGLAVDLLNLDEACAQDNGKGRCPVQPCRGHNELFSLRLAADEPATQDTWPWYSGSTQPEKHAMLRKSTLWLLRAAT